MPEGVPQIDWDNVQADQILPSIHERLHQLEAALTAIGYDAKAANRQRFPSKKQQVVLQGITRALCVETIDPWKENRVRFYHPLLHKPDSKLLSLPFAAPVSAMGGFDDSGLNWVPPAGSTILVFFEGGARDSPFYIGTTWHRDRTGLMDVFPSREWQSVYDGKRGGYIDSSLNNKQVLPPWNTESYNASDIDQIEKFTYDTLEQKRITYPNIYGFKTPEKHMLKMVDGNAKCNRRWKRIELMSGCGNWMIFKDDHLHYGGQWSHPDCNPKPGGESFDICSQHEGGGGRPYFTDIHGSPVERAGCNGEVQQGPIFGVYTGTNKVEREKVVKYIRTANGRLVKQKEYYIGKENPTVTASPDHSPTPCDPESKYCDKNTGTNKFFKHKNECRPYRGVGTPQNNRCDLPQSGIQFLSIGGHTLVMDDSVEEPKGKPEWERSLQPFDYGCNDKSLGRTYWKSMHGHSIMMSDYEEVSDVRSKDNFIRIKSATGNSITLNDHTVGQKKNPLHAGEQRGIHMQSTSNHVIKMIDHMNLQVQRRQEGGIPQAKATQAYIQIRSGYGLEMRFNDDNSQEQTQNQWIQITHPQCANPETDSTCNAKKGCEFRGPHFLRFQGRPKGSPGIVFLRAGGHSIRSTYDMDIVLVGDKECNPSDKFTYVSKKHIRAVEDIDFRYTGELHILFAEKQILLMAGRDCPPTRNKKCWGPCLYNVIIARCPVYCPLTGILHWTEKAMSERVFASGWRAPCPATPGPSGKCSEDEEDGTISEIVAGAGGQQQGQQNVNVRQQTQPGETRVDPNTGSTVGTGLGGIPIN